MGNLIEIKHSDGSISRYGHLSAYKIKKGQKVSAGQLIGLVGSTGNATGPHLHFEIMIKGKKVNPLKYI
jgi:murein DD-endopeptidase MepM/ murein hydrolase activator NlpD